MAFVSPIVSRLSVVTAYVAFAFVGAIVLGVFLRHSLSDLDSRFGLDGPAVHQPPGVFMGGVCISVNGLQARRRAGCGWNYDFRPYISAHTFAQASLIFQTSAVQCS